MSGEPVAIFLSHINDVKEKKAKTTKEERKKQAEMNEAYYLRENHEKELLLKTWICKYYDARPEYSNYIRRIIQSKQQQKTLDKETEKNILLLKKLNSLLSKKKIRGVHNRHATLPSQYNLCYFIESTEKNEYIPINLLDSYYRELRHYQTRYFDGFRERQHKTSLSRLNYFKWVHELQLFDRMHDIEQLVIRLESKPTTKPIKTKKRKRNDGQKKNDEKTSENNKEKKEEEDEHGKEIYLFHHPQYLTLPQKPVGFTRITLNAELEERILLSCPLYETARLTF